MSERQESGSVYYCPTAGELEQQPGGGFDVCCDAPERHVTREQLAKALHELDKYDEWDDEGCNDTGTDRMQFPSCKETYLNRADAVLALFDTTTSLLRENPS